MTSAKGAAVPLQVNATQPDNDQLVYDDAGALPSGLTIDSLSGVSSGTVADDAAASCNVTLTATDDTPLDDAPAGNPVVASESFVWTINTLHDPSLGAPSSQVGAAGDPVHVQLSATDAPGNTLTYGATDLPDGLGSTPAAGSFPAPSGTTRPDRTDVEGASVSFQTPEPYPNDSPSYTATDLPNGVSIDPSTGLISGGIADADSAAGLYLVTVTTTYGDQTSTSQTFNWTIQPAVNGVPTLDPVADQTSVAGTRCPSSCTPAIPTRTS